MKILFLGANGLDTSRLRISTELREVQAEIERAKERRDILVRAELAVRPADLHRLLLDEHPDIVHFSGHGVALRMPATTRAGVTREFAPPNELGESPAAMGGQILLEDQAGKAAPVPADALTEMFATLKSARCVVLNACFSAAQAEALAEHVDAVIGMTREIGDDSAIAFAVGFYQALSRDLTVKEAFDLGRNMIGICGLPDADVPQLHGKEGTRISPPNRKAQRERIKASTRSRNPKRLGCVITISFTAALAVWASRPDPAPTARLFFPTGDPLPLSLRRGKVVVVGPGASSPQGRRAASELCEALGHAAREGRPPVVCQERSQAEPDEGLRTKAIAEKASVLVSVDEASVARIYPLATLASDDLWARGLPTVELSRSGEANALAPLLRELASAAEERPVDRARLRCGESLVDESVGVAALTMFLRLKWPNCLSLPDKRFGQECQSEVCETLKPKGRRMAKPLWVEE